MYNNPVVALTMLALTNFLRAVCTVHVQVNATVFTLCMSTSLSLSLSVLCSLSVSLSLVLLSLSLCMRVTYCLSHTNLLSNPLTPSPTPLFLYVWLSAPLTSLTSAIVATLKDTVERLCIKYLHCLLSDVMSRSCCYIGVLLSLRSCSNMCMHNKIGFSVGSLLDLASVYLRELCYKTTF